MSGDKQALRSTDAPGLSEAEARRREEIAHLRSAAAEMREAQEAITDVEGDGSAELYDAIADAYQAVDAIEGRMEVMKPTGMFT